MSDSGGGGAWGERPGALSGEYPGGGAYSGRVVLRTSEKKAGKKDGRGNGALYSGIFGRFPSDAVRSDRPVRMDGSGRYGCRGAGHERERVGLYAGRDGICDSGRLSSWIPVDALYDSVYPAGNPFSGDPPGEAFDGSKGDLLRLYSRAVFCAWEMGNV